jgi:hypothetical protein
MKILTAIAAREPVEFADFPVFVATSWSKGGLRLNEKGKVSFFNNKEI